MSKELEFARKINPDKVAVNDFVKAKKSAMIYKVVAVSVGGVTIQAVDDCATTKTILKASLARAYEKYSLLEKLVPEAVEVAEEVEPEVEPNDTENQVQAIPVTTISTEPKTVQVKVSVKPKSNGKKKLTNEQYIQIAEDFLKGVYKTKKELATKYGVDPATISDMLSDKYCRKACKEAISALKIKYGYSK